MTSIDIPIVYNNLKAEIASLHTMLAGKEQEIVSLRAREAELERELDGWKNTSAQQEIDWKSALAIVMSERDKALADLAAADDRATELGKREAELESMLAAERELRRMYKEGCDHWCAEADRLAALLRHIAHQPRMPERVLSGELRETITLFDDDIAKIDSALAGDGAGKEGV